MTIIGTAEVALNPETSAFGGTLMSKMEGIVGAMATPLGALATAGVAAGAALFEIGESFESAYRTIAERTGAVGEKMDGLEASFKKVYAAGPDSMGKVADALSLVSDRTKLAGSDLDGLTETELNLARVTGGDVKNVVDETTKAFANWGITGVAPSKAALDALLQVSQSTGVSIDTLSSDVIGKSGSIFRGFGLDIGSTADIMGSLEAAGVSTGPVVMGLGKAFTEAQKSGKDAHTVLTDLFHTLKDGTPGTADYEAAIKTLGSRSFPLLQDAVKSGKVTIEEFSGSMAVQAGLVDKTAQANLSLGEKFEILKNKALVALEPMAMAVVNLATTFVDDLFPALDMIGGAFSDFFGGFNEGTDELGSSQSQFAVWGAVAYEQFLKVQAVATEVFDYLSSAWKQVAAGFEGGNVVGTFSEIGRVAREVADFFRDHWQPILIAAGVALGLLTAPVTTVVIGFAALYTQSQTVRDAVSKVGDVMQTVAQFFMDNHAAAMALAGALTFILAPVAAIAGGLYLLYQHSETFRAAVNALAGDVVHFADFFVERWDKISVAAENVFNAVKVVLEGFFIVTLGPLLLIWQNFGDQIMAVIEYAWSNVEVVFDAAVRVIGDVFDVIVNLLSGNWGDAWSAFADIPAAAFDLVTGLFDNFIGFIVDFFSTLPGNILSALGDLGSLLLLAGTTLLNGLFSGIVAGATAVASWFVALPGVFVGYFADAASWLVGNGQDVIGGMASGITSGFVDVTAWFVGLPGVLVGYFATAATWLLDSGKAVLSGMWDGIKWVYEGDKAFFTDLPGNLVAFFTNAATWLLDSGKSVLSGMWSGMQAGYDAGVHFLSDLPSNIWGKLTDADLWLGDVGRKVISGLWDGMQSMTSWLGDQAGNIFQWVVSGLGDAGTALWDAAVNVVVGFWHGIESMKDWLFGKIGDFFSSAWGVVTNVLSVFSPSRVSMETGAYVAIGFGDGITGQREYVMNAIQRSITGPVTDALGAVGNIGLGFHPAPGFGLNPEQKKADDLARAWGDSTRYMGAPGHPGTTGGPGGGPQILPIETRGPVTVHPGAVVVNVGQGYSPDAIMAGVSQAFSDLVDELAGNPS